MDPSISPRDDANNLAIDPEYARWRAEHVRLLDEDYRIWRQGSATNFPANFEAWRLGRQVDVLKTSTPAGLPMGTPTEHAPESEKAALLFERS
jgi:hypothetical protein